MKCTTRCGLFRCAIPSSRVTSFHIRTIRTLLKAGIEIKWKYTVMDKTMVYNRWIGPSVQRTVFGDRLDYLAMDKMIRWIGPSVQRTIFGDRLDYLAVDKIIRWIGPSFQRTIFGDRLQWTKLLWSLEFPTIMITHFHICMTFYIFK